MREIQHVGILGAGAFGTSLAIAMTRAGRKTMLWVRRDELAASIRAQRENANYLPGVPLPEEIEVTSDPKSLASVDALFVATPAQYLRGITESLSRDIPPSIPLVTCAKGIERETLKLPSEILSETAPQNPLAVLSGPTFAAEVARGLPSAITLAAYDPELGRALVEAIGSRCFRPYLSDDLIGAQVGGAVKNVLAIACGIVCGRKLGDNARAALITRGLAEIVRLGRALGGRAETLMGLSGLGDLTLTCSAMQSRNFSLGVALGEGRSLEDILSERRSVAEGVHSANGVVALAKHHGLDMPISKAVDAVLNHGAEVEKTIEELLARPFKQELS